MPSRLEDEPSSEQRLAIGGANTSAPARRLGWRTGLERGLDGGDDELRGLRVDDDVPAEQNTADDLPGMRGRIVRADGGGLGHTRTVEETTVLVRLPDTPDLQRVLRRSPGGAGPVQGSFRDPVANRSIYIQSRRGSMVHGAGEAATGGLQPPVTMTVTCHSCWGSSHAG